MLPAQTLAKKVGTYSVSYTHLDVYKRQLSDYINILKDGIRDSLRICKGDIFAAVSRVLDGVIALGRDERNQKGMKNIIGEADKNECTLDFILNLQDEIVKILVEGTDRTLLKNETDDEPVSYTHLDVYKRQLQRTV